jgi:hypothetical protein
MTDRVPQLFDVIECDRDFPELGLVRSSGGTIIECFGDGAYEVEFCNDDGETLLMVVVSLRNAVLGWDCDRAVWRLRNLSDSLKRAFDLLDRQGKTFMAACCSGEASVEDLDSFIDAWSETVLRGYGSLREVLGMTEGDFLRWQTEPSVLADILAGCCYNSGGFSIVSVDSSR